LAINDALKTIQTKGPQGEPIAKAINQASDPEQKAALAGKLVYGIDLKALQAEALRQGAVDVKKLQLPGVPEYLRNKWALLLVAGIGSQLGSGSMSPYMKAMAVGAAGMAVQGFLADGLKWALKNSVMDADKFVANIGKPTDVTALKGVGKVIARGTIANFIQQNNIKGSAEAPTPPKIDTPRSKAESVSMRATGSTKLSKLSEAPIQASLEAYNKAVNEDSNPEMAKQIKSIINAKVSGGQGLQGLDAASRIQLADMLKTEPQLSDLERERNEMRGST